MIRVKATLWVKAVNFSPVCRGGRQIPWPLFTRPAWMRMKAVAGPVVKRMLASYPYRTLLLCHHGKSPTWQVTVLLDLFSPTEWRAGRTQRAPRTPPRTPSSRCGGLTLTIIRQLISIPEKQAKHSACMEDRLVLYLTLVLGSFSHSLRLNTTQVASSFLLPGLVPKSRNSMAQDRTPFLSPAQLSVLSRRPSWQSWAPV